MIFSISNGLEKANKIQAGSFVELNIWERQHIEEWIRTNPEMLGEDLLIVSIEFDRFSNSNDRLDVLALDRSGNLVVIELKRGDFKPEYAGKMNFYLKAVDSQLRSEQDEPTIGILICRKKDKLIAEYALSDIKKPIGISEYRLTQSLPKKFKSSLPSIKEIEAELSGDVKKKR